MLRSFTTLPNPASSAFGRVHRALRPALMLFAGAFLLAACEREWSTDYDDPLTSAATGNWRVSSVQVSVPDTLSVSDANRFFVHSDIVWHGDPAGDRRAQVAAITKTAAQQAASGLHGSRPVEFDITILKFHGVTPITVARAPAAVHNMQFAVQIRDARTGAVLAGPSMIRAEMPALVNEQAYEAAQFGPTQKDRVSEHLAKTFSGWLGTGPDNRDTFVSVGQ
ncbi:DUF6778 family protein [Microbulbifer sp. S227A]|uniref:DUF6778 family protein n=1 Tax=Microbulbifer sp. S227A TaxID=3415131 RepID=UPI003C7B65CE